jgi:amidase
MKRIAKTILLAMTIGLLATCAMAPDRKTEEAAMMDVGTFGQAAELVGRYREHLGDNLSVHEITSMDATELSGRIRAREISSVAVVVAYLDTILRENPAYNAVVTLNAEAALKRAEEADDALDRGQLWGPLHGVPFTLKDTYSSAGVTTTAGYPPLSEYVPDEDAVVLQRMLEAGAILLGKSNTPILAMDMQTTNDVFGTTNNAIDPTRTAGGSSGGAAVAIARGMTPVELGSDVGGSLRVPAAFNGVYGFRPTYGLVSMTGHIPPLPGATNGIRGMAVAGPLARSARDLELVFDIISGPGPGDRRVSPVPGAPEVTTEVSSLRIAWATELGGVPVSAEIASAIETFADAIKATGAKMERADPAGFPYELAWETWGAILGSQGGYERSNFARSIGSFFARSSVADSPMQRRIVGPITVHSYMESQEVQDELMDRLDGFLSEYDAWIVPVSSTVAFPHMAASRRFGDYSIYNEPIVVDGADLPYYVATQSYATIFTVTESPVVTLPIGQGAGGMPIGVQVVGRRFSDYHLLAVARALEEVVRSGRSNR